MDVTVLEKVRLTSFYDKIINNMIIIECTIIAFSFGKSCRTTRDVMFRYTLNLSNTGYQSFPCFYRISSVTILKKETIMLPFTWNKNN